MRRRRRAVLGVAALASLAALGWVVWLLSADTGSEADYYSFRRCPLEDPRTDLCLFTQTEGGELVIGEKTLPMSRTITLQGGVHAVENGEREIVKDELIPAAGGETVSGAPQVVPGGLRGVVDPRLLPSGLRKAFKRLAGSGTGGVTATVELAEPPSSIALDLQNLVEGSGTALVLPVKVRLGNRFLGASCYVGSNRRPMLLRLTTGVTDPPAPNRPIHGKTGKASLKDDYNLTVVKGSSFVNNSFAAPGAQGCGGTSSRGGPLDRAVDAELHLPAPAGRNTAILSGTLQEANAPAVKASE